MFTKKFRKVHSAVSRKDESGAAAVEYGLLTAAIAVVIITAARTLGLRLSNTFTSITNAI